MFSKDEVMDIFIPLPSNCKINTFPTPNNSFITVNYMITVNHKASQCVSKI